ncbi:Hint domain-containing protein [Sphingomonas sp. KR3-1]|uniref:Hint domain-containing protein n=1 Tax=Sphingomonas sp. KR3-1 TaxID=3156611 RepID=UPI0032B50442
MAGDPSNPFNTKLGTLNGVNFGSTQALATLNADDLQTAGDKLRAVSTTTQTQVGTLTVVDYTYMPGSGSGANYRPPVFGIITFSQIDNNSLEIPGAKQQYAIIGFSPNGLLLYKMLYADMRYISIDQLDSSYGGAVFAEQGFNASGVTFPVTFGYDASVHTACFAEGTPLLTPTGDRLVEDLVEGDAILTATGEERAIKWIGWTATRPARHAHPDEVYPVRVKAHAFAPNVPERDVRLSPGHAVHVDGVLVPAGRLINGATIVQEAVESIRYFHIELDTHDLLIAAGLPCESYLDDGNRATFLNSNDAVALHGRLDPKSWDEACAPLVAAGPQLLEIQQRLHARAEALGWVRSEEPDFSILADGVALMPVHAVNNRYWFALPAAREIALRSNRGVLSQLVPGLADHRQLGVAVSQLRLDGEVIDLESEALASGFHALEQREQARWRWTDGDASLKIAYSAPAMLEVELVMVAPSWSSPIPALRVVA